MRVKVPLVNDNSPEPVNARLRQVVTACYRAQAGIAATAAGAWASVFLTGAARIAVWLTVSGLLVMTAGLLADPVATTVARLICGYLTGERPGQ
jgi:hypothetical protein